MEDTLSDRSTIALNFFSSFFFRFSKDMGAIDELLPMSMGDVIQIGLSLIAVIIIVAIINTWLLIPTVFILGLLYVLRVIYISTSRSLKRLEGISKYDYCYLYTKLSI